MTHPINRGQSFELKSSTCACPLFAIIAASLPKMYIRPAKMNASAISAVVLSLAKLRISARGRKMTICRRIKYCIPSSLAQFVIARVNDCRFSETNIMYAETKPS